MSSRIGKYLGRASLAILWTGCSAPPHQVTESPVVAEAHSVAAPLSSVAHTPPVAPLAASAGVAVRHAAAEGPGGSVSTIDCTSSSGLLLGIHVVPQKGEPWSVSLEGVSPNLTDQDVRFVDVDHDGLPDPVVRNTRPNALVVATVFLVKSAGGPGSTCLNTTSFDPGSEGFLLGVSTLDEAAKALAAVPNRGPSQKEACAYLAHPTPSAINVFGSSGTGPLDGPTTEPDPIIDCNKRIPDGKGFLKAALSCDDYRPYCAFALVSGGTSIPATERRYWFDLSLKRLVTVGVEQY